MRISEAIDKMIDLMDTVGDVEIVFAADENGEPTPTPVNGKVIWGENGKPDGLTHRGDRYNGVN